MKKALPLLKYVLLAVGLFTILSLLFMSEQQSVSLMLNWAYIVLGLAVLILIVMPLINIAQNPKGALRTLIGLGIMAVVLGISYALASTEPVVNSAGGYFENATELRLTDTGLIATYITLGAAFVITIFGEIVNSFK